jgi:hypothetical protein
MEPIVPVCQQLTKRPWQKQLENLVLVSSIDWEMIASCAFDEIIVEKNENNIVNVLETF